MSRPINYENEKYFLSLVDEGYYTVYKDGKIYNNKTKRFVGYKPNGTGYGSVARKFEDKTLHYLTHRLVFLVHGGVLTEEFPLVNHKDGNKLNNSFDNLEASNDSHNIQHAYDTGLHIVSETTKLERSIRLSGENGAAAKLTNDDVREIRTRYATEKISHRKLAEEYGVAHKRIGEVLRNQTFKNV